MNSLNKYSGLGDWMLTFLPWRFKFCFFNWNVTWAVESDIKSLTYVDVSNKHLVLCVLVKTYSSVGKNSIYVLSIRSPCGSLISCVSMTHKTSCFIQKPLAFQKSPSKELSNKLMFSLWKFDRQTNNSTLWICLFTTSSIVSTPSPHECILLLIDTNKCLFCFQTFCASYRTVTGMIKLWLF